MTKEMFVQFSKKAAVNEVMKKTGMSKKRAVKAVEELERRSSVLYGKWYCDDGGVITWLILQ